MLKSYAYNNTSIWLTKLCHHFPVLTIFFSLAINIGPQALPFSGITKRLHFWLVGANVKSWEQVLASPLISTGTTVLLEVKISLMTSWFSALESVHVEYTRSPPGRKALIADLFIVGKWEGEWGTRKAGDLSQADHIPALLCLKLQ